MKVHPWRRYCARQVDYLWFALMLSPVENRLPGLEQGGSLIWGMVAWTLYWIPLETILLATVGTTPGKYVIGIEVCTFEGKRLDWKAALRRSILVAVVGQGAGMIAICQTCEAISGLYLDLRGRAWWDGEETQVRVGETRWGGVMLVAVTLAWVSWKVR